MTELGLSRVIHTRTEKPGLYLLLLAIPVNVSATGYTTCKKHVWSVHSITRNKKTLLLVSGDSGRLDVFDLDHLVQARTQGKRASGSAPVRSDTITAITAFAATLRTRINRAEPTKSVTLQGYSGRSFLINTTEDYLFAVK